MRLQELVFSACLIVAISTGCDQSDGSAKVRELSGATMGTTFSVSIVDPAGAFARAELQERIEATLSALEAMLSTYRPDSELSQLNSAEHGDWIGVSAELCNIVEQALQVSNDTDGAFDITVGPLVNLWGFGPDGDRTAPPADERIAAAMDTVGFRKLHADCTKPALQKDVADLYVDLSAIAKGYAVDRVADLLDAEGVASYLVEVGGELRMRGQNGGGKDWQIAIEKPLIDQRTVQSVFGLSDIAIATSGDYRNYFIFDEQMYSHTIDPRTGYPVRHNGASVSVIDKTATFADAMATALLVLGPDDGLALANGGGIAALFLERVNGDIVETRSARLNAWQEQR